jgi:hypothetical protein
MKLAEALALRAETVRRVERLRVRVVGNARYQEGEEPAENAKDLLVEAQAALDEFEALVRRINRTNAVARLDDATTLTDALARRDTLRMRYALVTQAADAAAGKNQQGQARQLRSELKMYSALPVVPLRNVADVLARDIRELDLRIQRANWEVDLLD